MPFSLSSRLITLALVAIAAAASQSSAATTPTASRRGIAWPYFESTDVSEVYNKGKVSWVYDYEKYAPPGGPVPKGMEFNVMQRTNDGSEDWLAKAAAAAGPYVLGYNEPDNPNADGSGISPKVAAQLWKKWFEPIRSKGGKKLVAPAVTSGVGPGLGLDWLDQFVSNCTGCHFDAFAFHPYSDNAKDCQSEINSFIAYKKGKYLPVWITEFGRDAANIDKGSGVTFMNQMLPYLDSKVGIQRYAYIARIFNNTYDPNRDLQNTKGALTPMGKVYIA